MKKFICAMLAVFMLTAFAACLESSRVFSASGASITLPSNFYEKEQVGFTACFMNDKAIILLLKEDEDVINDAGHNFNTLTLGSYAELILQNNSLDSDIEDVDGLTTFFWEKSIGGKDYYYLGVVFKSDDAFWFFQFCCEAKNKDTYYEKFIEWAKTITFEE